MGILDEWFAPQRTTAVRLGRPKYEPLTDDDGDIRADIREKLRGRAGVYILRKKGNRRPSYVGSSVPGEKAHAARPERLWKTILRHFQKCRTLEHAPRTVKRAASEGGKPYNYGSDNFCRGKRGRAHYELAIIDTPAALARKTEKRAIKRFRPLWQKDPDTGRIVAASQAETPF
jgi:hypothetical protein